MPNISSAGWARSRTIGRGGHRIEYIAVHYTATRASANANCRYFASRATGASAHYFIDGSGTIWQSVPDADTAYAVGNWNANQRSVSIEVVSAGEDFSEAEIAELAWFTQRLMRQYGVPASKVVRHYDFASIGFPGSWASPHKLCPRPYIDNRKWAALHSRITTGAVAADKPKQEARQTQEADEMKCIIVPDGANALVYFDGQQLHYIQHPDGAKAINQVYRATHNGADIPTFAMGSANAPWAGRLSQVLRSEPPAPSLAPSLYGFAPYTPAADATKKED